MNNVEENEDVLSQLLCYIDAVFIDWDDTESSANMASAFQLATLKAPAKPFEKHKTYTQN